MALSGSFDTNTAYNTYFTFSWTATQDTTANTSRIKWTLTAHKSTGGFYNCGIGVWIDGAWRYSHTESGDRPEVSDGWSTSDYLTLSHDSSTGKRTFYAEVQASVYTYAVNATGSKTFTLNTIPRGSTITTIPSFVVEDTLSCTYQKNNNSFTDNLTVSINNTDIATFNNYVSGETVSLTDAQILNAYSAMGTAKSADFTFTLKTYDGGSQVGTASTKLGTGTCRGTALINDGDTWKYALPWVNDNGTWKKALAYTRVSGTWKRGK